MGTNFIRGRREQDKRRRDQAFDRLIRNGSLFDSAPLAPCHQFLAIPQLALKPGDLLTGLMTESDGTWLVRGSTRALEIPPLVVEEIRGGKACSVALFGDVVSVDEDTKIATIKIMEMVVQ